MNPDACIIAVEVDKDRLDETEYVDRVLERLGNLNREENCLHDVVNVSFQYPLFHKQYRTTA